MLSNEMRFRSHVNHSSHNNITLCAELAQGFRQMMPEISKNLAIFVCATERLYVHAHITYIILQRKATAVTDAIVRALSCLPARTQARNVYRMIKYNCVTHYQPFTRSLRVCVLYMRIDIFLTIDIITHINIFCSLHARYN